MDKNENFAAPVEAQIERKPWSSPMVIESATSQTEAHQTSTGDSRATPAIPYGS
jgi:hypothetical protein